MSGSSDPSKSQFEAKEIIKALEKLSPEEMEIMNQAQRRFFSPWILGVSIGIGVGVSLSRKTPSMFSGVNQRLVRTMTVMTCGLVGELTGRKFGMRSSRRYLDSNLPSDSIFWEFISKTDPKLYQHKYIPSSNGRENDSILISNDKSFGKENVSEIEEERIQNLEGRDDTLFEDNDRNTSSSFSKLTRETDKPNSNYGANKKENTFTQPQSNLQEKNSTSPKSFDDNYFYKFDDGSSSNSSQQRSKNVKRNQYGDIIE